MNSCCKIFANLKTVVIVQKNFIFSKINGQNGQKKPKFYSFRSGLFTRNSKKHSSVIECKKTDRVGAEEKLNVWKDVEREFNSKFSQTFRNYKVLKTKYFNIKATAKQNFASDKRQTYKTGGVPVEKTAITKTDEKVLEICQETQILGKPSIYDCDIAENEYTDIEIIDEFLDEVDGAVGGQSKSVEVKIENDISWAKYTPHMLKNPPNKNLKKEKVKEKEASQDCWAKLADAKLEKQQLEVRFLKEKHELEVEKLKLEIAFIQMKLEKLQNE